MVQDLIEESYRRLFPGRGFFYRTGMEYNRRLGDFNANILLRDNVLTLRLNLQWRDIDEEIKIGLVQHLLLKIFRERKNTPNLELYHNFIKNLPILTAKTKSEPALEESFQRINERFFLGKILPTNLGWGTDSFRKLGSYNFHNDTITISTLFREVSPPVLDYLMFHEMLHKHFKFISRNGRSSYHSPEFRKAERSFPGYRQMEEEIERIVRRKRRRRAWSWF